MFHPFLAVGVGVIFGGNLIPTVFLFQKFKIIYCQKSIDFWELSVIILLGKLAFEIAKGLKMKLNKWQQEVVDSGAKGPIVVEACPGSGKTRTLEETVAALVLSGADPLKIGVFTFTRSAAAEARRRVARTMFPDASDEDLEFFENPDFSARTLWVQADPRRAFVVNQISTIHALAFRTLKALGYDLKVLSGRLQWDADAIIKDGLKELDWDEGPKSVKKWISFAVNNLVEPRDSEQWYAMRLAEDDGPVWVAGHLAELYKRYSDFCKRNKVVDFDMMQARLVYLLRNSADARSRCQEMYDYILVDEAQDTNPTQSEIIFCMASRTGNLLYCGDVDQSCFAFRNAQPSILREDFEARWPNRARFNLPINYRSTRTIIDATTALIQDNYGGDLDRYLKPFQAREDAPAGEPISYTEMGDFGDLADEIANAVKEQPGDWFILSRTRAECAAIHTSLIQLGIPAINKSGGLLFGAPHIRKVLAYARLACNYHGSRDDLEILKEIANVASAEFRAPMTRRRHLDSCRNDKPWIPCGCPIVMEEGLDYSHSRFYGQRAIEKAGGWQGVIAQQFEKNRGGYDTINAKGSRDLVGFVTKVERVAGDARAALNAIIEGCVLPWLKAEEGISDEDLAENGKAEDFSLLANLTEPDESLESYLDRVEELSRGGIEGNDADSALLGTIHWSKGAERPKVAVNTTRLPIIPPQAKPGQLPTGRPPTMEEERRLLFIAMTRAQDECHLFGSLEWNNQEMERSKFVQALIDKGVIEDPDPDDEENFDNSGSFTDREDKFWTEQALADRSLEKAPCGDFGANAVLQHFPNGGRLDGNICRFSGPDFANEMGDDWMPFIEKGQLAMIKTIAGDVDVIVLTGIKPGEIAPGSGEDSIRIVLREGDRYRKGDRWTTRTFPKGHSYTEALAQIVHNKVLPKVKDLTENVRPCECGGAQVKLVSKSEKNPNRPFWRCRECEKFEWVV